MSLTASELTPADIAAVTNGNGNNMWNDGGSWWLIILFLFCFMGWGGNGWNNGGGNGGGGAMMPYMMNSATQSDVQGGFDHAALMNGLNGITSAVNNGFANAEVSRCNSQANVLQTLNNNHSGLLQAINVNQAGLTNQLNTIAMNQQNCCCEGKAAVADLKYTVATEACADRSAVTDALRSVIENQTANTQAILDKLCQQEIDQKNETIANLRTQLNMANLASSQTAQTGQLMADNAAQTAALINQLRAPAPVPAYIVQNPNGCGCGNYAGCGA